MIVTLLSPISGTHYKETKAYSQQTLALSILLTALLALVLGFTVGLLVSRRCHQQKQLHLTEIYDKTLNFTKWVCVQFSPIFDMEDYLPFLYMEVRLRFQKGILSDWLKWDGVNVLEIPLGTTNPLIWWGMGLKIVSKVDKTIDQLSWAQLGFLSEGLCTL